MFESSSYQRLQRNGKLLISATLAAVVLSNFSQVSASFKITKSTTESVSSDTSTGLSLNISSGSPAHAQIAARPGWSELEQNILEEHNRIRQNPHSYIPILEAHLNSMTEDGHIIDGCGHNCVLTTREGRAAVQEAIAFLQHQPAVGALAVSTPIARAAKSHARDQRSGATGHIGSDGTNFSQRLNQFGVQNVGIGENIAYGSLSAEQVVMNLVIDDGVASRGHRTNIFSPGWTVAGVGCGDHTTYQTVCVVDYAAR